MPKRAIFPNGIKTSLMHISAGPGEGGKKKKKKKKKKKFLKKNRALNQLSFWVKRWTFQQSNLDESGIWFVHSRTNCYWFLETRVSLFNMGLGMSYKFLWSSMPMPQYTI